MILDLSTADMTAITTVAVAVVGAVSAVIRHLYVGRENERNARLADAERYTATMLDVQERLRAEDARENAELRAKLDAALVQRPSSRRKAKS